MNDDVQGSGIAGPVPVFPLPNVVFFPRTLLPLHIFEPRYRVMTRSALDGDRLIALALLRPGWEPAYQGNPPIHDVLGLGRIVEDTLLEDGRFNLVLEGVARVQVEEIVGLEPYRTARVRVLENQRAEGKVYDRRRRVLQAFYAQVVREITKGQSPPPDDLSLGLLCDLLASMVAFEPSVKQELLEELDEGARCNRLLELLRGLQAPGIAGADRPWPPDPSDN